MKKLLLILLCLPFIGLGQAWEVILGTGGDSRGRSVQQTTDEGYIVCGYLNTFTGNSSDIFLIKVDENGIEQWSQTFGGIDSERGYSVQQTMDGGYILCGGTIDIYLIKTDINGVEQWTQTFGGSATDRAYSVEQTTDGGYILCGISGSFGNGSANIYLVKTDSYGIEQWSQTFGGTSNDGAFSLQQTSDGGYIIAGTTESFSNLLFNAYLIKTDGSGVEQWSQIYGDTASDAKFVRQTIDGGYIITGTYLDNDNSQTDIYLLKVNSTGTEQWSRTFGEVANIGTRSEMFDDEGKCVQQTNDGGFIITGSSSYDLGIAGQSIISNLILIKTDNSGLEEWRQIYGAGSERGYSVQQTNDGGYIVTGETGSNIYLIKTDVNGNVTSTFNITINLNRKLQNTVDILGKEIKPRTNTPFIEIYDDGSTEKKIIIE